MRLPNPYLSLPQSPCYDGEPQADEAQVVELVDTPADGTPDAPPVEPTDSQPEPEPLTFTEADVEARIAEKLAERDSEWKNQLAAKDTELSDIRSKFNAATVERSLTDAIVAGDGISVEQVMPLLKPYSRVDTGGNVIVEVEGFTLTAQEAISWMRAQVDRFGNLFKANMISGLGGHSAAGGARATRTPDVRSLGPAEYRAAKKQNPTAYGFRGVG